jgi:hypothetical protein
MFVDNLEGLQDFTLSFKRDIILCKCFSFINLLFLFHPEMLSKSQTMFNFGDIKDSLYSLYAKKYAKNGIDLQKAD